MKCGKRIQGLEAEGDKSTNIDNSVLLKSPGAGSVYAPTIDLSQKGDEKQFCPVCKNEIGGERELVPCGHCHTLLCNKCGERNKRRYGDIDIPRRLRKDYFEPLCKACWEKAIGEMKEYAEKMKDEQEEPSNLGKNKNGLKRIDDVFHSSGAIDVDSKSLLNCLSCDNPIHSQSPDRPEYLTCPTCNINLIIREIVKDTEGGKKKSKDGLCVYCLKPLRVKPQFKPIVVRCLLCGSKVTIMDEVDVPRGKEELAWGLVNSVKRSKIGK